MYLDILSLILRVLNPINMSQGAHPKLREEVLGGLAMIKCYQYPQPTIQLPHTIELLST